MMHPIVVVGGGGHAKVVIDVLRRSEAFRVIGCIDPHPASARILGIDVLGGDEILPRLRDEGLAYAFIAIGDNRLRLRLATAARRLGFALPALASPGAVIAPSAAIGSGTVIMDGAVVQADTRIGELSIVNTNASVDHDCQLEVGVHVGPGSTLAGGVQVGTLTTLGAGTVIIPGVRIGACCTVGAGAVVTCDLPDRVLAVGVPARVRKAFPNERTDYRDEKQ